jgi:hypothetical protein
MHPPASVTMFSFDSRTSAWSMGASPHSFTTIAVSAKRGSRTMRFTSVDLPLPRKPVSTVTGVTSLPATAAQPFFPAFSRRARGCAAS